MQWNSQPVFKRIRCIYVNCYGGKSRCQELYLFCYFHAAYIFFCEIEYLQSIHKIGTSVFFLGGTLSDFRKRMGGNFTVHCIWFWIFFFYNIHSMKKMNQNTLTSLFFRNSLFKKKRQHSRQSCPGNAKLVC